MSEAPCNRSGDSGLPGHRPVSRRELGLLIGLLALALVSRYVLWQRMLVVSKDSIDFVNIARSFAAGDVTTMLGHYQHPLYPFLMVLCNTLVGDWILAGQVVSLGMSVLALIPFYLLVRRLFGPRDAVAATLLMMFLPRAATLSADILTESTYLAMCLAALCFGYRAAAPALLCNDSYYEERFVKWDPEAMELA